MTGPKLNERPGTKSVLKNTGIPPTKARQVLDLIRNKPVNEARQILQLCPRAAAKPILKALNSAIANAESNSGANGNELKVSACFADEARSLGRIRPRARGRASSITKRSSHVTIIVGPMTEEEIERQRNKAASTAQSRQRRVRASRRNAAAEEEAVVDEVDETTPDDVVEDDVVADDDDDDDEEEIDDEDEDEDDDEEEGDE